MAVARIDSSGVWAKTLLSVQSQRVVVARFSGGGGLNSNGSGLNASNRSDTLTICAFIRYKHSCLLHNLPILRISREAELLPVYAASGCRKMRFYTAMVDSVGSDPGPDRQI